MCSARFRLEKSGQKTIPTEEIKTITDKIEEEMYRVYGKVDNSYKNKFRSLLANISNMNNNVNRRFVLCFRLEFCFSSIFSFFISIFSRKKQQLSKS